MPKSWPIIDWFIHKEGGQDSKLLAVVALDIKEIGPTGTKYVYYVVVDGPDEQDQKFYLVDYGSAYPYFDDSEWARNNQRRNQPFALEVVPGCMLLVGAAVKSSQGGYYLHEECFRTEEGAIQSLSRPVLRA